MTFDVYIPALKIIAEYQGFHHYYDHYLYGDVVAQKERDKQKRVICVNQNINYLEIPFWWKRDKESVLAIIHQVRPDVVSICSGSIVVPQRQMQSRLNNYR